MDYDTYREQLLARLPEPELAFPVAEYESRLVAVRRAMAERGLDLLMVTDPAPYL